MYLKKLFYLITIFTITTIPIFSFATDDNEDSSFFIDYDIEVSSDLSNPPNINARYAVIFDRASHTILYGKNANEKCKMASTTKIMTALVVIENCNNLDEIVTVSKKAAGTGGSRLGLSLNDKISVINLLYGLMMVSGNDAAIALSEFVGGSVENFVNMMNQKALSLNLTSTHFITPHGLDQDEHYTTAFELATLSDYALKNEIFSKIVRTTNYTININNNPKSLHNTNELLGYLDGVYGVKTGFTNGANRCLVTSCKREDLDIICVVLGCDTKKNRTLDSINLINYTFNNFSIVNIRNIINKNFDSWLLRNSNSIYIYKGASSNLNLYLNESQIPFNNIAINNEHINNIDTPISFSTEFVAPLLQNTVIGKMTININGVDCFCIDILNKNAILKKSFLEYLSIFTKNYFRYFYNIL